MVQRCRSSDKLPSEHGKLSFELRIDLPLVPSGLQLLMGHHERLGDEPSAEDRATEVPLIRVLLALSEQLGALGRTRVPVGSVLGVALDALEGASRELAHAPADSRDAAGLELLDNLRAHHAPVRKRAKLLHVRPRRDAKADDDRQIVALRTALDGGIAQRLDDALALGEARALHFRLLLVAHPRHPEQGDHVHHARDRVETRLSRHRNPLGIARG